MKKFPITRIVILADIKPMELSFHAVVGFGLGKKLVSLINCDGLEINFLDRKFFMA